MPRENDYESLLKIRVSRKAATIIRAFMIELAFYLYIKQLLKAKLSLKIIDNNSYNLWHKLQNVFLTAIFYFYYLLNK